MSSSDVVNTKYDLQLFATAKPAFGLLTRTDKNLIDAIPSTYLSKTDASSTYTTINDQKQYIKSYEFTNDGIVIKNGNDQVIDTIWVMKSSAT